jgi:hypothetical protein
MKKVYLLLAATLVAITVCVVGCLNLPKDKDVLFQTSTLSALSEGDFDGDLT